MAKKTEKETKTSEAKNSKKEVEKTKVKSGKLSLPFAKKNNSKKEDIKKTSKKASDKKANKKNNGFFGRFFGYFGESYQELRKVTWPTRKETIKYTIIILVISAISALYLGGVDYLATKGLNLLLGRK